jgi:hypothetical protein
VASWLKAFRSATTEMSRTKEPMLSTVHAIFRGLQEHIRSTLAELPDSAPMELRDGLVEAHQKLSEYYYRSDESPFYTWAASKLVSSILALTLFSFNLYAVLDPRIMYEGLKNDCESDPILLGDLDRSKKQLQAYYRTNYTPSTRPRPPRPSQSLSSLSSRNGNSLGSPEKVNFTSRYQKKDRVIVDELEEYFKLPREDFESCKPLLWWSGRRSQFPNLYCLVRDIFSIPGKFIQVSNV